jgi:hypothetical protein
LCNDLELVNEPGTEVFEQGIVVTFLFVQVGTNWIRESAIKIKDVYYSKAPNAIGGRLDTVALYIQ